MIKRLLICCFIFVVSANAQNVESDVTLKNKPAEKHNFVFVGVSLTDLDELPMYSHQHVNIDIMPAIEIGVGESFYISPEWQMENTVSLTYSDTDFTGFINHEQVDGNYQEFGLWGTTKLRYEGFSDTIHPFVKLGVGAVNQHSQLHDDFLGNQGLYQKSLVTHNPHSTVNDKHQWNIGYKLMTGLSFETSSKSNISIGVGYSNID